MPWEGLNGVRAWAGEPGGVVYLGGFLFCVCQSCFLKGQSCLEEGENGWYLAGSGRAGSGRAGSGAGPAKLGILLSTLHVFLCQMTYVSYFSQ